MQGLDLYEYLCGLACVCMYLCVVVNRGEGLRKSKRVGHKETVVGDQVKSLMHHRYVQRCSGLDGRASPESI